MDRFTRATLSFALALCASPGTHAQDTVFPGREWEAATPESQNVGSRSLHAAVDYLAAQAGSNGTKRMVVVRNGRMIWKGAEADVRQGVWSITKAFTSTAHGLLIEDGKCTLDTLAKDYDPALTQFYPTVTLRHLATMTSGIDGVGGSYDTDDQGRSDANALVAPQQPCFAPGTKFMYWDEATQHYGFALTQIAGEPLHDYLKRRILDPLGITQFGWQNDVTGKVPNWTGGIETSASDLARFGLLFLNGGRWHDRQLVSADWVAEATRVQVPATIPDALPNSSRKGSGIYGYHWWPNGMTPQGKRHWPHAPSGTYGRSGYNNNDLFVIPAWNMVVVRLGLDEQENEITTEEYDVFLRMMGEAILDPVVDHGGRAWHPLSISFRDPTASESDVLPNPFVDYRLQVKLTSPTGRQFDLPGFFDGDGFGGGEGNVWRARFTPDELWDATTRLPGSDQLPVLEGVEFRTIKPYEFSGDGYRFLHGVALAWHKERLYASFGHNKGGENTDSEEARCRVSDDGGETWSPVFTIDAGAEPGVGVSHGVFLSHQGRLWAFHGAYSGIMQDVHTRAYLLDEATGKWQEQGTVVDRGFWPMQEPRRMDDGNWIMSGIRVGNGDPAAVAISHGDDLLKWDLTVIPPAEGLGAMWGESSVILQGRRIMNIARYGERAQALVAISEDFGRIWTASRPSNLPMATSKPYTGTLSTGQHYLIATTTGDSGARRSPLTIAVTRAGEAVFREVFVIRHAQCSAGQGESHPHAALAYPYAVEHDGRLYIAYSNNGGNAGRTGAGRELWNNNSAEMAIVPVRQLEEKQRSQPNVDEQ